MDTTWSLSTPRSPCHRCPVQYFREVPRPLPSLCSLPYIDPPFFLPCLGYRTLSTLNLQIELTCTYLLYFCTLRRGYVYVLKVQVVYMNPEAPKIVNSFCPHLHELGTCQIPCPYFHTLCFHSACCLLLQAIYNRLDPFPVFIITDKGTYIHLSANAYS